jgi:hypothetical protein
MKNADLQKEKHPEEKHSEENMLKSRDPVTNVPI